MKEYSAQIQFQTDQISQDMRGLIICYIELILPSAIIEDNKDYVNFRFKINSIKEFEEKIKQVLDMPNKISENMKKSCIIVCQGEHGWDDYKLIHSFNED